MPTFTKNYNLKKPSPTEKYNIQDMNGNMDQIDDTLKKCFERTEMTSPFTGIDDGNKLTTIIQEVQTLESLSIFLTDKLKTNLKQNIRFIINKDSSDVPDESDYPWLIETFGLGDGVTTSSTILVKATELGGIKREYQTFYDMETESIGRINSVYDTHLYPYSEPWLQIYPLPAFGFLNKGSIPAVLDRSAYVSSNEETNTFEKVVSFMIAENAPHITASYVYTETTIDESGGETTTNTLYTLEVRKIAPSEDNTNPYYVERRNCSYPYTIEFNFFNNINKEFITERWKQIYPIETLQTESDPIFTAALGIDLPIFLQDIWDSNIQNLEKYLAESVLRYKHFEVQYIEHIEDISINWIISVNRVTGNCYTIYRFGMGENYSKFYREFDGTTFCGDWIVLYPYPEPELTSATLEKLSSMYDPLYGKIISMQTISTISGNFGFSISKKHAKVNIYNTQMENGTVTDSNDSMKDILNTINSSHGTPDIHLFEVGYCDFVNNVPVGTVDLDAFIEEEFNSSTFAGALEIYISTVIDMWPDVELIMLIDIPAGIGESLTSDSYVDIMYDICEKWEIVCIDPGTILHAYGKRSSNKYIDTNTKYFTVKTFTDIAKYIDNVVLPIL